MNHERPNEAKAGAERPVERVVMRLLALAEQLPRGLRADWDGTNHFELTTDDETELYWWLDIGSYLPGRDVDWSGTDDGRKIGLLLDIAQALKEAEPELRAFVDAEAA